MGPEQEEKVHREEKRACGSEGRGVACYEKNFKFYALLATLFSLRRR